MLKNGLIWNIFFGPSKEMTLQYISYSTAQDRYLEPPLTRHVLTVLFYCIKPKQNRMELLTKYVAAVARLLGLGPRETKPLSRSTSHSSTVTAYWGRRWWLMKGPFYSSPQPPPEVPRQIQAGIPSRINSTKVWPFLEQTDSVGVLEESTAEPKSKRKKVRNAIDWIM